MAKVTSGSFDTEKYGDRYLVFSWSATQDTAKNQSTISWTLKGAGGTTTSYYMSAPFSVTIAGEEVYQSDTRIQLKNGTVVKSGTKTITHKDDGTKSFSASVKAAIYSGSYNVSGSGTWDLKDIPRAATITSAPNFTDEENPTIKYSNALGNGVDDLLAGISFDKSTTPVAYRSISKTGTSYTFNFTDAEREALWNNCKNSNSTTVYFYLRTVINGKNYHHNVAKTLTIVNATPTLTVVAKDAGAASTALTGDNQKMIKGFNYVNVALTATALKGASIKSYKITNGSNVVNAATGNFNNTEDNKFVCVVTDSRGNPRTITKELTMINYTKLTAAADMKIALDEDDGTKANITVNMNGNYFNGSFGAKSNSLRYDIKITQVETGASYTNYETIPTTDMSGGKYNHTYTETQLPYQNSWKVELRIYDEISSITLLPKTLKAQPIFDWGENDFNFNVPIYYSNGAKRKLFYEPGDSITFGKHELNIGGVNTNSGKDIYFTIPINKPIMAFGCDIEGDLMVRGIKGYVNTAGNTATNTPLGIDEAQTITVGFNDAGIMVKLSYASTVNSGANNTPVSISSYPITITFN